MALTHSAAVLHTRRNPSVADIFLRLDWERRVDGRFKLRIPEAAAARGPCTEAAAVLPEAE